MKIKFKLLTTILIASQLVFFIVLAGCGGGDENLQKTKGDPNAKAASASAEPCPVVDLEVSGQTISIFDYFEQSEKFLDECSFIKNSKEKQFSDFQFEVLKYSSIKSEIDFYKKIHQEDSTCRSFGLRVFPTLDIQNEVIKLYYVVDWTKYPVKTPDEEKYDFEFINNYNDLDNYLNDSNFKVYESINRDLVDISKDADKKALARTRWNDYMRNMKFDKVFFGSRVFNAIEDVRSVYFPDEEIMALGASDIDLFSVRIVSAVKYSDNGYRHTFNLSNILPRNLSSLIQKTKSISNKTQSKTSLNTTSTKEILANITQDEINKYRGSAANYGQLCPSKCKGFKAKKIENTNMYIIDKK